MQRLSERRNILCLKFAKKSLKVDNFGHLFPLNSKYHDMKTRKSDYYKVSKSYSKRYLQSAIPSMQRMLNMDIKDQHEEIEKASVIIIIIKIRMLSLGLPCTKDILKGNM